MKALIYIASFALAFALSFIAVALLLALIMAVLSFVVWSLPLASPFNWVVFRILCIIAGFIAISWSFSKENKEWAEEVFKDLKGKKIIWLLQKNMQNGALHSSKDTVMMK